MRSFGPCSGYAFALSALIFSSFVTYALIELFIRTPYELGTHTEAWMRWHGVGCFFVGLMNLRAMRWDDARAARDVAGGTALIYGVWSVQNFALMFSGTFRPLMWLHVILCGAAAVWSVVTMRSLSRAPAAPAPLPATAR